MANRFPCAPFPSEGQIISSFFFFLLLPSLSPTQNQLFHLPPLALALALAFTSPPHRRLLFPQIAEQERKDTEERADREEEEILVEEVLDVC
jgi:hypothetical protein